MDFQRDASEYVLQAFIDVGPVCNAHDADELRRVVDDLQHPPIACPNAPLIFVASVFCIPRPQVGEQRLAERIQSPLRRPLDFEGVFNHVGGFALGGSPGIVRKECPFPSGTIQTPDHPRSPPRWPVFFQVD
jgi:hypothetical protein